MTDPTPAKLREILLNEFSEEELKALSASIDIDYDKLSGTGTFGKTRALIDTVKSQDKMRNLQARVRELRPAAYEAAGIGPAAVADALGATPAAPPAASRTSPSSRPSLWPWIALALVILMCTIAGVALLAPRLQQAASVPAGATSATVSTPTSVSAIAATATETPPAIVEVTEALDKGAEALTTTVDSEQSTPNVVETPLAPAKIAEGNAGAGIVITVTATATPVSTAAALTTTATPSDTHPSVTVIRDLNNQLPAFYRGEVDAKALQQNWTGEALRSVVGFGMLRLPRAMRIQPSQRDTLKATYAYRREPTLTRETTDGAIVTSREYWDYATSANATEICETRDYVYNLVRVDGQYKVSEFSSRLVDSGCE